MPGPFYARYVPPKAPSAPPPKVTQETLQPLESFPEPAPVSAPGKKEKEKRPKKRKREEARDPIGGDAVTPKKHKTVLSKFEKSTRLADIVVAKEQPAEEKEPSEEPELHGLVPLPQPAPVPEAPYDPRFSALPSWLAKPITAPASARKSFEELNIDPKLVRHLKNKGYNEAFAVQSAVLPLLLPGAPASVADVCVSAATGSGKTLAYVLPMIENMRHRAVTRLRGVIVVPTRELVSQVREAAELCAVGSGLKIGTAMGNHAFSLEQGILVKKGRRYDPETSKLMLERANERLLNGWALDDDHSEDVLDVLPGHVPDYESRIDILICTPGRLVEHLQHTKGFHLDDVEWLVIDEADRLLDQSFQGWAESVMKALEAVKSYENSSPQDRILSNLWYPPQKRYVRKVVLSATMTRDLSKLSALKLRRPTLVIAEGTEGPENHRPEGEVFDLPASLYECAVPVGDGSQKPLYLLHLLKTRILWDYQEPIKTNGEEMDIDKVDSSESESSSSSDTDSSDESDESSVSSDSESSQSESDSSSDSVSSVSESPASHASGSETAQEDAPIALPSAKNSSETEPIPESNVLIFTHNNENANRLSRLLSILCPAYASSIGTLTKSSTTSASRKILRAFRANKLRILIASDRASRGLDLPNLAHIINYDIPTSVTSYVHRVGRTARAGMEGLAWTFLTKTEAGWYWNVVARGGAIRRGGRKVERLRIEDAVNEESVERYEEALGKLKDEVRGGEET